MKFLSLLLSMMVLTVTAAQKPLDRGIHKRKTGGISFLFGKTKGHADARFGEEVATLKTLAPANVNAPLASGRLVETTVAFATETQAPFKERGIRRSVRPLNRRGISVVVLPSTKTRLLRRPFSRMVSPAEEEATYDWASITGLAMGLLALLLIDSSSFLTVILWLLGLGLSLYGLFRTKNRNLRGRKLAVWGVVLFGISPLALLIGVVLGGIGIF